MAITNHERVGNALDLLRAGLGPFVEREIKAFDARSGTPRASLKGYGEDVPPYFALDGTHRRIWTTREKSPVSHAWPDDW